MVDAAGSAVKPAGALTRHYSVMHDGGMTGPVLTALLQVRLRPKEKRALARLAKHYERTPSEVVRRLIGDETARLEGILTTVRKADDHGSEEKQ